MNTANSRFSRERPARARLNGSGHTQLIWDPDEVETHYEQPKNAFCYFRKSFELPAHPAQAEIRLFADSRYKLFVNGVYIGRGPCRSDPRHQYYDVRDIRAQLKAGPNVIAILALHYGYGTGQSINRIPALLAEGTIGCENGDEVSFHSDSSWKCAPADAYCRIAPRINGCQGPVEIFDAGREPAGWTEIGYNDDAWKNAKGRGTRHSPFWNWAPRDIPLLEERETAAGAIVSVGALLEQPRRIEQLHHQIKAEEAHMQLEPERIELPAEFTIEAAPSGEAHIVTFAFPEMEAGYLQLELTGRKGDVVDAVYAEELWEGKAVISLNSNRPIDRFILSGERDRVETAFAWRAFRYVQFRVRNPQGPVTFHKVGMRTRKYPLEKTASFQSGDKRLTDIWDISARTLRLCMQDGFLDSSSREQQQWMGDGRWQALFNAYYSGDPRLHRKLLEQIGQSQDWTGMTTSRYPDGHHNYPPIPSFCLAWVCSFAEYRLMTGDAGIVSAWWPNLVHALRWFAAYENGDGLLEDVPYWSFIDWAEGPDGPVLDDQRDGIITALNLQYLEALQAMIGMAQHANDREAELEYAQKASRLQRSIQTGLWDESRGAYADCKVNGELSRTVSEPTNALAVLHAHEASDERAKRIYRRVFAPEAGGHAVAGSPYFMLVIGRALIKLGAAGRALELIRERYGNMLDAGSGTTWERWTLFHMSKSGQFSASSASHAWAAAPIAFVFEGLFGIKPLQAGFQRFSMNPDPCGLSDIRASLPVGPGELDMELRRIEPDKWNLKLRIPEGCSGEVCGMELAAGEHTVTIEGRRGEHEHATKI